MNKDLKSRTSLNKNKHLSLPTSFIASSHTHQNCFEGSLRKVTHEFKQRNDEKYSRFVTFWEGTGVKYMSNQICALCDIKHKLSVCKIAIDIIYVYCYFADNYQL